MKKIKIGLPRAFLYHRYGVLWKTFFANLNCQIVVSPETNRNILELGINNTLEECCLSYKIYIGHVLYLKDKCDYILISRICNYGKKEKVCTIFNGTYDVIKNLIPKKELIEYNIDHMKLKYEFSEFLKMGLKVNKNIFKVIYSYLIAKNRQKFFDINKENEEKHKLYQKNKKILIVSQSYNIKDNYISKLIIDYLENSNITVLCSNRLNKSLATSFSEYFSETLNWKYAKETIGSIYYYRNHINGIIFISTYPCGQDSLVNNLAIYKNNYLPILNIIIDENINDLSLETKLESFTNIVKGAYNE